MTERLSADLLLSAYASGVFPMAEHQHDDALFWVDPHHRGIIPLDSFHISRSLRKTLRSASFNVTFNTCFQDVVAGCADRPETWINAPLFALYQELFTRQHAHSIEVWNGPNLVGGVFGVTLGGAFFGESMFSRQPNASKVALAHLVEHLNAQGFTLFDTQFITPHLKSLGAIEISKAAYHQMLKNALRRDVEFSPASNN